MLLRILEKLAVRKNERRDARSNLLLPEYLTDQCLDRLAVLPYVGRRLRSFWYWWLRVETGDERRTGRIAIGVEMFRPKMWHSRVLLTICFLRLSFVQSDIWSVIAIDC
jgi:hypothetical protein